MSLLPAWLHSLLLPRHKHIFSYWFDVYFQRRDFFFKLCSNSTLFPHSFQSEKSEWDPNFQTGNLRQDCRALVVEKQCGRFLFGIEGDVKINLCELIRVNTSQNVVEGSFNISTIQRGCLNKRQAMTLGKSAGFIRRNRTQVSQIRFVSHLFISIQNHYMRNLHCSEKWKPITQIHFNCSIIGWKLAISSFSFQLTL